MKALCWFGRGDVRVEDVPEPKIVNPHDAIVRVTSTAICGSDLHLYNMFIPAMKEGDVLGHEFMGEVVEVGREVTNLAPGDRVVVPFPISCGSCWYCRNDLWSLCDNTNPNAGLQSPLYGQAVAGIFGYSHLLGGYAGGQAEYVRVPFANVGPLKVDGGLTDDQVLFLTDILPTGYQAADQCEIKPGDVVAVWGAGPVGQFAIRSAALLGAERILVIDRVPSRLQLAEQVPQVITIDYEDEGVYDRLMELTAGRGPDACIDAVGLEAHGLSPDAIYDYVKTRTFMATDRAHVLRQAIHCCRKGGTISVVGVYGGFIDKFPMGALMNKGLTLRAGQAHVHRYMRPLLERIQRGEIDPTVIISHHLPLEDAAHGYEIFRDHKDECTKVVLKTAA